MRKGVVYAVCAYVLWGLFPLYWKALANVPATQLIAHRITWSFLLLTVVLLSTNRFRRFARLPRERRTLLIYSGAALLITVNWLTFVWAVNAGFVLETSLGYFINPLLSVALGVVFLRERLRPLQWAAVILAASGVTYLTFAYGSLPWIALTLAGTFAIYGLVKKVAPLDSVDGLALETGILFIPALGYLALAEASGIGAIGHSGIGTTALLMGAGVATTAPLLLFASATRRIPLFWIGILQYIAPTIQFLLGVLVYHEVLSASRLAGFAIVWSALVLFAAEGALAHRTPRFPVTAE
jgi:chloramphenicol-sensitive protein RarD